MEFYLEDDILSTYTENYEVQVMYQWQATTCLCGIPYTAGLLCHDCHWYCSEEVSSFLEEFIHSENIKVYFNFLLCNNCNLLMTHFLDNNIFCTNCSNYTSMFNYLNSSNIINFNDALILTLEEFIVFFLTGSY